MSAIRLTDFNEICAFVVCLTDGKRLNDARKEILFKFCLQQHVCGLKPRIVLHGAYSSLLR